VWQDAGLLERGGVLEVARGRRLTEQEALLVHDQEHWYTRHFAFTCS
jgi:hypothetical protein